MAVKIKKLDISERPISKVKDDCFEVELRIVNKIYDFMQSIVPSQLTIAVTGEWGIGKSSVINLLLNKLKDDEENIVIIFEPLLEGKFEISEIMSLFYLKLYQSLKSSQLKKVVGKCLKSAAILSRFKFIGNAELDANVIGVPGVKVGGKVEYNLSEHIDALLKLWDKEKPQSFSEQTKKINDSFKKKNHKLYVVIDEIDRLPASHIINFLLFCRILESFDNLICIVGIDYEQMVRKLIKESSLCVDDYKHTQIYLEKLFQAKFHVHHNKYKKIEYTKAKLVELDCQSILANIFSSADYKVQGNLMDIFDYLSTPRQIKKWLISIKIYYVLLQHSPDKLGFIAFLAVIVKHPLIVDYLSKHTMPILSNNLFLSLSIKKNYGIDFSNDKDIAMPVLLASLGVKELGSPESLNLKLDEFMKKLSVQSIEDGATAEFLTTYLNFPRYLIALFVEGFSNESQVSLFEKFFGAEIDDALKMIDCNDSNIDMLASDIAQVLEKGHAQVAGLPNILLLNRLWKNKIGDEDFFGNPYEILISYSLRLTSLELVIDQACLALSEYYLSRILYVCKIANKDGSYQLSDLGASSPLEHDIVSKGMQNVKFQEKSIFEFDEATCRAVLNQWIKKVEADFKTKDISVFSQPKLLSVFYRYIQWGKALGSDLRGNLVNFLVGFLEDKKINENHKKYLKEIINKEKKKFESKQWGIKDPLEVLFNNNMKIYDLIN